MADVNKTVTIIGLGSMGTALAQLLLNNNYAVTVWNRTKNKADDLLKNGAVLAADMESAVKASTIIVVCVADYDSSDSLLKVPPVSEALKGKLLIQLSTGTPKNARDAESWATSIGLDYLDGAILVTPSQMGTEEAVILISGKEEMYKKSEVMLKVLAAHTVYLGTQASSASALDLAFLSYFFSSLIGFSHAALICEAEAIPVSSFGTMVRDWSPAMGSIMKEVGEVIEANKYNDPKSSLKTCYVAMKLIAQQAKEANISARYPTFGTQIFKAGMDAGLGAEDGAAIFKVLKKT